MFIEPELSGNEIGYSYEYMLKFFICFIFGNYFNNSSISFPVRCLRGPAPVKWNVNRLSIRADVFFPLLKIASTDIFA
jgi:hypothetical protein